MHIPPILRQRALCLRLLLLLGCDMLSAQSLSVLQQQLQQIWNSPNPSLELTATLLKQQLGFFPFPVQELRPLYGGLASLWVYIPGREAGPPLLLSTRMQGGGEDVLTLLALLPHWQQQQPRRGVVLLFLGEEEPLQPERTRFIRSPYSKYSSPPFQASMDFLVSAQELKPVAALYLRQQPQSYLETTPDTAFWWLQAAWNQFHLLGLPLRGGMRSLSRQQAPPALISLYAQQGVPLLLASLPPGFEYNARMLAPLAEVMPRAEPQDFFYTFVWQKKLRYLGSTPIITTLFLLWGCWVLLLLLRPRKISIPLREKLHFIFTLMLVVACYLSSWLLVSRILFNPPQEQLTREALMWVLLALLSFHLLLFFLHKYSPRPLSCLRFSELLTPLATILLALQDPLLALGQAPLLLSMALAHSLKEGKLRRFFHLFYTVWLLFFYALLLLGPPVQLLFSGDTISDQWVAVLVILPLFFFFLGSEKISHRRPARWAMAQHGVNVLIFALLSYANYLSLRNFRPEKVLSLQVDYLLVWDEGGELHSSAKVAGNGSLEPVTLHLGTEKFASLSGVTQLLPVEHISLPPVQSKVEVQTFYRRRHFRLLLNYPHRLRTLHLRLAQPAGSVIAEHAVIALEDQATLLRFDRPQFPLQVEWSSSAERDPAVIELAASLEKVPFVTTVAASGPLQLRKSCQLYWSLRLPQPISPPQPSISPVLKVPFALK